MADHSHNAFRGLYDMFAEMGRMREHLTQGDHPSEAGPRAAAPGSRRSTSSPGATTW